MIHVIIFFEDAVLLITSAPFSSLKEFSAYKQFSIYLYKNL